MKIDEIYSWLIENDPVIDNPQIRMIWSNMASYCYYINAVNFGSEYQDRLVEIFKKSHEYNITIPDKDHSKVLELSQQLKSGNISQYLINSVKHVRAS